MPSSRLRKPQDNSKQKKPLAAESYPEVGAIEVEARQLVLRAAQLLKTLGPERQRVGWMLEDSLMYLDELSEDQSELPHQVLVARDIDFVTREVQLGKLKSNSGEI